MIFTDLDNTLVCVREKSAAPQRGHWTDFTVGQTEFRGIARPSVHALLTELRALGPVRLLTFSRRNYALAVCHRFDLGFQPDEVLAQDDWWGGWLGAPRRRESTPTAADVLIANESDLMNQAELAWLGPRARLVVVSDYTGDGDVFSWEHCIATFRKAIDD